MVLEIYSLQLPSLEVLWQLMAIGSLFPIKMIAKLLRTKSNAQKSMDTRDHRMGATINNESPEIEPPP